MRLRKPKRGLVLTLAEVHGLDLEASTMIGDSDLDRRVADAAGIGHFSWAADYFGRR
jgi:histidinol phosphatase-like enzyme